jgi:hypothetical protein
MTADEALADSFFSDIAFADDRERAVFLSYLRGFSFLFLDATVTHVVEIGAGHSTAVLALLAERCACRISTIDMNPGALAGKLRDGGWCDRIFRAVAFRRGPSIGREEIARYYDSPAARIGGVSTEVALEHAAPFLDVSMDARKLPAVLAALAIERLSVDALRGTPIAEGRFPPALLSVFREDGDELAAGVSDGDGLLEPMLRSEPVDAVFLDSGEFSSLPEWKIVADRIRRGGYVILHDIFFPKSFKNWLVGASIAADSAWRVVYIDRSTPQGLLVARRL